MVHFLSHPLSALPWVFGRHSSHQSSSKLPEVVTTYSQEHTTQMADDHTSLLSPNPPNPTRDTFPSPSTFNDTPPLSLQLEPVPDDLNISTPAHIPAIDTDSSQQARSVAETSVSERGRVSTAAHDPPVGSRSSQQTLSTAGQPSTTGPTTRRTTTCFSAVIKCCGCGSTYHTDGEESA